MQESFMEMDHAGSETVEEDLQKQRQAMEEDFGRRRAKFKEMFLQKEEELKQQQELVTSLQAELDDARTALAVAEVTFENQLDVERRKHAEEMASIQHLEKEQASSLVEDHVQRYQAEIRQLRGHLRAAEHQLQVHQQQQEEAGFGPHVLTDLTKQLAKKIALGGTVTSPAAGAAPGALAPTVGHESLDDSMKRAKEDSEMMRSLVVPLEMEISALKEKLRSTDAQLQVQLAAREQLARAGHLLSQLQPDTRVQQLAEQLRAELPAEPPEQLAQLVPSLYMYISVLEAQKLGLSDDLKYAKQTHSDLRSELERVRQAGRRTQEQTQQRQRRLRDALPPALLHLLDSPLVSPAASQRSLDAPAADQTQPVDADRTTLGSSGQSQDGADTASLTSQRDTASRCERCTAAEAQLQQLQADCRTAEKRRAELERALERHQQDLSREARYRKQTELQWQRQAEQYQVQIGELYRTVEQGERQHQTLQKRYKQFVSDIQDRLRRLTADRHLVQQELDRLQSENDTLVGKHSASSAQLQNEFINLPDKTEDLHLMVLRYRDELISAKIAREHVEETLAFTKNEQQALQHEKDALSDELAAEHEKHREEALVLESVQSELEAEQSRRRDADVQLTQLSEQLTQQTAKSKQIQAALQTQLQQQSASKSSLTEEVTRLKTKVATLQLDLDNSEAVQRDFVKLSQSLQMELERIRQADTEVRWQHEEDVDACSKCSQRFSVSKRKHHCRHCGKIFCNDCLSRSVPSGPSGTLSRVCDVCHTLLNSSSAPYFSSQPPGDN